MNARSEGPQGDPLPAQRFRSLFEQHPHAVFGVDLEGRFVETNAAAKRISGYLQDELLGTDFAQLILPEHQERAAAAFLDALARRPQRIDLTIRHAKGHHLDLDVTAIPVVVDNEVLGVWGLAEDITERNRQTRELTTTRRLAATAVEARKDFVARMSHEVRTPLFSILAATELLADTSADDDRERLVQTITRSGHRLMRLVDQVLDFDSVAPDLEPAAEDFDLHAVILDAVALADASARRKQLRVHLRLDDAVPRRVRDHPTWTSQILVNLLSNAVAHTTEGHVALDVRLVGDEGSRSIVYRVSDTGPGIDPAHHELIFQPFTGAPANPAATAPHGVGLGLSIVQQLVSLSRGTISVDSAVGEGATFTVVVPVVPLDAGQGGP